MWLKHHSLNEHEQKLVNMSPEEFNDYMMLNYPDMFKNRYPPPNPTVILPMYFGFEIGPGWRHVLDSLCSKLKVIQKLTGYVCVFDQIKEKWGGARFYYHTEVPENDRNSIIPVMIEDLVNKHEEYCDYVCEELGTNIDSWEKIHVNGWYYGMGLKGFEKWVKREFPGDAERRIELARKDYARQEKIMDLKDNLVDLNDEDLAKTEEQIKSSIAKEREKWIQSTSNNT